MPKNTTGRRTQGERIKMTEMRQRCRCGHIYRRHRYLNAFEQPCEKCDCKAFKLVLVKKYRKQQQGVKQNE